MRGAILGVAALLCACGSARSNDDCTVGSRHCECTPGGGCDPDLSCVDGICVLDTAGDEASGPGQTTAALTTGSTGMMKLDVGGPDMGPGNCAQTGCKKVDLVFAIDSSLSMIEEIDALSKTQAFSAVVSALADLNCGEIDYRIGLTNDNDGGWITSVATPFLDSANMSADDIAMAFSAAAGTILGNGGTPLGCEHVLTSAADLLGQAGGAFLREDALLVLVLLSDADDYGEYDQVSFGGPCAAMLCTTAGMPVDTIYNNLLSLKADDPAALATIVVAGDPTGDPAGLNLCQQPASCCGVGGIECGQATFGTRLYEFADLQTANNGVAADICLGAAQIPTLIETALREEIDLACQDFVPPA